MKISKGIDKTLWNACIKEDSHVAEPLIKEKNK
jgi:hypothetical protein